jgi:B9 domain-containing protein 2
MAHLHLIGEISGGTDFSGHSFFCTYEIVAGKQWKHVAGATSGTTHIMQNSHDGIAWSLPLDVHYTFQHVQGWPKISLRVWSICNMGRKELVGYGVAFIPLPTPGSGPVKLNVPTWKPDYQETGLARVFSRLRQSVMGGNPVLRDESLVHNNDNRFKLFTTCGGNVQLSIGVLARHAEQAGLRFS